MKQVAAFLLGIFLLVGCSRGDDIPSDPADMEGTLLAYFIANNNLEDLLFANVVDMYKGIAAMDRPAEFLVYWDGAAQSTYWSTTSILRYRTDGKGNVNGRAFTTNEEEIVALGKVLKEYPSQLASDKEVMGRVLQDMMNFSSYSTHHGLVIGSHGSGWLKHIDGSNSRALGPDGAYVNSITIPDMVEAMQQVDKKFEFLLFDACAMACAEVFYEVRTVTNYVIASVIDVPSPGFPYSEMVQELVAFTSSAYQKACEIYIDRYQQESDQPIKFGTISLVDCSELDQFASLFHEQIALHHSAIGVYDNVNFQFYGGGGMRLLSADLLQFVGSINDGVVPPSFQTQFDRTILYTNYVTDSRYYPINGNNYCGMGVYLPMQSKRYWNEYFQTLRWYQAAGWEAVTWPLPQ